MAIIGADTFTRADQSGWGTASDGESWLEVRGVYTPSISSNAGVLTYNGSTTSTVMQLGANTTTVLHALVRLQQTTDTTDEAGIVFRFIDTANFYKLSVGPSAGLLTWRKDVGGVFTTVASASFTTSAGTWYWLEVLVNGQTVSGRIWQDGGSVPAWQINAATDSDLTAAGTWGLCGAPLVAGRTVQFDHFSVDDTRAGYVPHETIYTGRGIDSTLVNTRARWYVGRGLAPTLVTQYIPRGLLGTLITPITRTALAAECDGVGTLASTFTLATALTGTLAGVGALVGTMDANVPLTCTIPGVGQLSGTLSLSTALSTTLAGVGTLSGTLSANAALSDTLTGIGTLTGTLSLKTALAVTMAGVGAIAPIRIPHTYVANPGDNITALVNALLPGDVLIFNNGTYASLFISGINGTSNQPITMKAANDGQALFDAGGTGKPIFVENSTYITLQGFVAQNSNDSVVKLFANGIVGNVDHIVLQRITAHGAAPGNFHVFDIAFGCTNVLVEDCAGWGRGRYIFIAYHSSNVTFRRCFGYQPWQAQADFPNAPRSAFGVYGSHDILLENVIGRHVLPFQADDNYYVALWHESDDAINFPTYNVQHYGCIFVDSAQGMSFTGTSGHGGTSQVFKDIYFNIPYSSVAASFIATRYNPRTVDWDGDEGGTIDNITVVTSNDVWHRSTSRTLPLKDSVFLGNGTIYSTTPPTTHTYNDYSGNTTIGVTLDGTEITTVPTYNTALYGEGAYLIHPSNLTGSGASGTPIGCEIIYQYVNGVLTNTVLWPWPMESRVVTELGVSPTYSSGGGPWTITIGTLSTTLAGVGTLTGTATLTTALTRTITGVGTLSGTLSTSGNVALSCTFAGTGTLSGTPALATALAVTLAGQGTLSSTLTAKMALTTTVIGVGTLAATLAAQTALSSTFSGVGTFSGVFTLRVALFLTCAGMGALAGTVTLQVFSYLTVTWLTRDGKATWNTRDDNAGWNTRDETATWKTRS